MQLEENLSTVNLSLWIYFGEEETRIIFFAEINLSWQFNYG